MTRIPSPGPPQTARVAYVLTHYPKLAQTFIAGEVDSVRASGVAVTCFAMNTPDERELQAPGASDRCVGTVYLKAKPWRAVITFLGFAARHPWGTSAVAWRAIASGQGSPTRIARRLAHLVQAALVAREVERERLSHIHAHFGLGPATIAWLASELANLRGLNVGFSFTVHGFHDFADPAEAQLESKVENAKAVMAISDFTRSQLCLLTNPGLWPKIVVLRCGVDLVRLGERSPRAMGDAPVVLAVGRLSREKGLAVLLEAVAIARASGLALRLRLVGDGPLRDSLERQACDLGLAGAVSFTGELPPAAVREELAAADVFCLPSFSEGLPVSIMEAMALGVPVVTTWIAGIPELAEHGVTALALPPGRADLLAAALQLMVSDGELRSRLTDAARVRVEREHDGARNGAEMAKLLVECAR